MKLTRGFGTDAIIIKKNKDYGEEGNKYKIWAQGNASKFFILSIPIIGNIVSLRLWIESLVDNIEIRERVKEEERDKIILRRY